MKKQSEKSEGGFEFLLPCSLYNSPLILFLPYLSFCRIPLIPFSFNLEYFKSDKTFQTRGSIRACILKPMYTNCIVKHYDIKKILLTILERHYIRIYVHMFRGAHSLGIHVCTYIKDHHTSLPIQLNITSYTINSSSLARNFQTDNRKIFLTTRHGQKHLFMNKNYGIYLDVRVIFIMLRLLSFHFKRYQCDDVFQKMWTKERTAVYIRRKIGAIKYYFKSTRNQCRNDSCFIFPRLIYRNILQLQ